MRFIIIERFDPKNAKAIYERVQEKGRLLPEGLTYLDSWVSSDLNQCFQLMACEDPSLITEWKRKWGDLAETEVVPAISSDQATAIILGANEKEP